MNLPPWPAIRPGSSRVEVYNEGLLVFLFDESQLPAIAAAEADFESGYAATDAEIHKQLKKLAKQGTIVAYELAQDDAVVAEVVVGPPLTKQELAVGRWHKPQTGFVKLPSGLLRIDTANTLPVNDEDCDEEPGRVTVPPGDYRLSLYRLNWDKLEADGLLKADEEWPGPQEILLLTPLQDGETVKGVKPLLRLPSVRTTDSWLRKYTIADGVFEGKAFANDIRASCSINIDRTAANQLGIQAGVGLSIEVDGLVLVAVYIGEEGSTFPMRKWAKSAGQGRCEFGLISRPQADEDSGHSLYVERLVSTGDFPTLRQWTPARVSLLTESFELPMAAKSSADEIDAEELAEIEELFE